MKKSLALMLCIVLVFSLASCAGDDAPGSSGSGVLESALAGTSEEILNQVLDDARLAMPEDAPLPMTFTDPVTVENALGLLGLGENDFADYVIDATVATAMIATFAFEVAVVNSVDANAAASVKTAIAAGYDPLKWICVFPEECFVVESGNYVLLVAARVDEGAALLQAFTDAAGGVVGTVDVFYTGPADGGDFAPEDDGEGLAPGWGPAPLPEGDFDIMPAPREAP